MELHSAIHPELRREQKGAEQPLRGTVESRLWCYTPCNLHHSISIAVRRLGLGGVPFVTGMLPNIFL
jgi:hypothetical protein